MRGSSVLVVFAVLGVGWGACATPQATPQPVEPGPPASATSPKKEGLQPPPEGDGGLAPPPDPSMTASGLRTPFDREPATEPAEPDVSDDRSEPRPLPETEPPPDDTPKVETPSPQSEPAPKLSDAQIKKILIRASIEDYPGNCPCPYHRASNGSKCGGRSAWSRGGGYEPLCFASDVSPEMIEAYREQLQ